MRLSFDYITFPSSEFDGWMVELDLIGGHNGYMADPYAEFSSPEQKVLQIHILRNGKKLAIMNTTRLVERQHLPTDLKQDLNAWEKVLAFFGFQSNEGREPGHVIYLVPEWDGYGRVGTLTHFLNRIRGDWPFPWGLITITVMCIFGAFLALLYCVALLSGIYRLGKWAQTLLRGEQASKMMDEETDKGDERVKLLEEAEDEDEDEGNATGKTITMKAT